MNEDYMQASENYKKKLDSMKYNITRKKFKAKYELVLQQQINKRLETKMKNKEKKIKEVEEKMKQLNAEKLKLESNSMLLYDAVEHSNQLIGENKQCKLDTIKFLKKMKEKCADSK